MNTLTKIAAAVGLMIGLTASPVEAGFFKNLRPLVTGAPSVTATVSVSQQRMTLEVVDRDGTVQNYVWKVSTGKSGYETPKGSFRAKRLSVDHWSKTYDAPMPYSVFFVGGYAIHATNAVAKLGQPASHGCIRLAKTNAAKFFELVDSYGKWKTKIVITD
jgi:lipoprotein-anchoring transpeptidase ErfK/SrfK